MLPFAPALGLVFFANVMLTAIWPLMPSLVERLSWSAVQAGVILSISSVGVVLVALPAGRLVEHFGVNPALVLSGGLLALAAVGHGVLVSFWTLLAARALLGVGFGLTQIGSLTLFTMMKSRTARLRTLGSTAIASGLGGVAGGLMGASVSAFGRLAPFLFLSGLGGALVLALAKAPRVMHAVAFRPVTVGWSVLVSHSNGVTASMVLMFIAGLVSSVVTLLVPLALGRDGVSQASIGILLAGSQLALITGTGVVAVLAPRVTTPTVAIAGLVGITAVLIIPLFGQSVAADSALLLLRGLAGGILSGLSFPLAEEGARLSGFARGQVMAALTILWGVASLVGPVGSGAITEMLGGRGTYLALVGLCTLATGLLMVRQRMRASSGTSVAQR